VEVRMRVVSADFSEEYESLKKHFSYYSRLSSAAFEDAPSLARECRVET
jgi:hypothetical protein